MQAKEQSEKTVKGVKEPEHAQAAQAVQAMPPMNGAKPSPMIWMPRATVPSHDTEIRHWGINE